MASSIGTFPYQFYLPDYSDSADIQLAIKQLYYGNSGGTATTGQGIYGALYNLYSGNPTFGGNVSVTGTTGLTGILTQNNTTDSSSVGSGSIITLGGLSVAKNTNIGGTLTVTGTINGFTLNTGASAVISNYLTTATAASTYLTQTNAASTYVALAGSTLTGSLTLRSSGATTAGTAPLYFGTSSPQLLATPAQGAIEYDGKVFYGTPSVSSGVGRGVVQTSQLYYVDSEYSAVNISGTTTQSVYNNALSGKSFWLNANTVYEIEYYLSVKTGFVGGYGSSNLFLNTSSSVNTTYLLNVQYSYNLSSQIATGATLYSADITTANNKTILAGLGTGTAYHRISIKGTIKTLGNAGWMIVAIGGDLTGGVSYSTTTVYVEPGSYGKLTPIGTSGSDINVGPLG